MLSIRLLGAISVTLDGQRLTIKRRKSRALLYFLAAHTQPVSRGRLLATLWADHSADTARSNLRSTLYNLRQALGAHLATEDDTVVLAGDVQVDVRDFTAFSFENLAARAAQPITSPAAQTLIQAATAALAAYRGDFLRDFDAPDTPEFEEWVARERERLRRAAIRGYAALSRVHLRLSAVNHALDTLEHALALDPFQEDLQRTLLALHYHVGDRAGVIRRYEEFRALLDDHMGVPPMAETQALYDAIVTDAPLPAPYADLMPAPAMEAVASPTSTAAPDAPAAPETESHTGPPTAPASTPPTTPPANTAISNGVGLQVPFTGRQAELETLASWQHARRLILIEGEPGRGKTSLVQHYLARMAETANPPLVLIGRARQLESGMPYQPIIEALRSLSRTPAWAERRAHLQLAPIWQNELARLVPELLPNRAWESRQSTGGSTPESDASRLWEGVYRLLVELAQAGPSGSSGPVVLFIDDLHWADTASLGLVGYLTRRMASDEPTLHMIAATQPPRPRSDCATLIQALTREELLHQLALPPLSQEDVVALARQISPHYAHPLGNWLYRSSEGSPFVLLHLLRHAREIDLLDADGTVDIHRLPSVPVVPQTVYTLVQNRLESLSESARRVLDAAVAVGREFEFEVVARASALSDMAALDALDELRRQRLIKNVGGERFAFDHTLTREVAYREVGELRHRLLHRRVAAALESLYPDQLDEIAGLLVHHYSEGNLPDQAYAYARRAGRRAAEVSAWQPASEAYRQALRLLPSSTAPQEHLELLTALGRAYLHLGEMQKATTTLHQAVEKARALQATATLRAALQALAEALINQGQYAEVVDLAQSLADSEDSEAHDDAMRFTIDFMWATGLSVGGSDLETAAERMVAAEARIGDANDAISQIRLAQIAFEMGSIDAQQGRLEAAIARYRRTIELTQSLESEDMVRWHILARNNLAYHLHLLGDPQQLAAAQEHAETGYALAREHGFLNMNGYLLSTLGEIAMAQDDLARAEHYFNTGLRTARQLTQPERIAGITANLGRVALARSQTDAAREHFQTALEIADSVPNRYLMAQIRLWLAPLVDKAAARELLASARAIIDQAGYTRLHEQAQALAAEITS